MKANVLRSLVAAALLLTLPSCEKVKGLFGKDDEFSKEMPDFGGVKVVEVEAEGVGPTRNAAVLDALNMALKQTNGTPIAGVTINSNGSLEVPGYQGDFGITNETVVSITGGAVKGFEIISEREDAKAKSWRVKVKAKVNSYEGSAAGALPKVVIATPRVYAGSYVIGDQTLSSAEAADTIRTIIGDAVSKSNRFFVINRAFDDAINDELAQITEGGNTNPSELAKLGQRLTADILVLPEITRLEYRKSTRVLRLSGRALNSYDGEAELSFNVINAVTGQLIMTERFTTKFPSTPPSVYGSQQVGIANVKSYLADISDHFTRKFILKNFPVAVVKMDGRSVVLSQGSAFLRQGAVYNAVSLGEDIKDPQTGQSLGRMENPIGTIRITSTSEKMSMGILSGSFDAEKFKPGMIELRDEVAAAPAAAPPPAAAAPAAAPAPAAAAAPPQRPAVTAQASKPKPKAPPKAQPAAKPKDVFDDGYGDF